MFAICWLLPNNNHMMERSPDLKKILAESISAEHVEKEYREESENEYIESERREQLRSNLEAERARITELEWRRRALLERCADMSDDDFDREYQEGSAELEDIIARIKRYSEEYREHRPYTVEFVALDQIEGLGEFLRSIPMLFIPRKEEVGRILALAKQMHESRIQRGEIANTDQIKIVDIGGANGALGKLVTDLARENGLDIEYIVVDPDSPTVQKANNFYKNNPSLKFREQSGGDFNKEQYRDNPEISDLLERRRSTIDEGERKKTDLQKVVAEVKSQKETLSPDAIKKYIQILKLDFGIDLAVSLAENRELFLEKFEDQENENTFRWRTFADIYADGWRERINIITEQIEARIRQEPARYDMVINSWMPVRTDLTKEVREANGAAILYVLERYGATGCRSDAPYPESPSGLGHGESYHPGTVYESRFGWISHSTSQVIAMMRSQPNRFWEYQSSWAPPFANGFVVQTKKGYGPERLSVNLTDSGIKVEGIYSWEKELTRRGGDILSTAELRDVNGQLNYFSPFKNLERELEERELKKRKE